MLSDKNKKPPKQDDEQNIVVVPIRTPTITGRDMNSMIF